MPNRIIRESARTSPTLDALSPEAERLFWRLITACDDHGRFDADSRVVLALCFPLKVGTLMPDVVEAWLQELRQARAVALYEITGRRYGYFPTWTRHQRRPQSRSKFPDPASTEQDASTVAPPRPHGDGSMSDLPPREIVNREIVNREIVSRETTTVSDLTPEQTADNRRKLAAMNREIAERRRMS